MNYLQLLPYDILTIIEYYIIDFYSPLISSIYNKFNLHHFHNKSLQYSFYYSTNHSIDILYYFIIDYNLAKKNNISLKASLFWSSYIWISPKRNISLSRCIS